jgi:hypothetical protein
MIVEFNCATCEKHVRAYARPSRKAPKYCSKACGGQDRSKPAAVFACRSCGKQVSKHIAGKRSDTAQFCTLSCWKAFQRQNKPVDRDWLHQKYIVEGLDCPSIATLLECDPKTVWKYLHDCGIPTRPRGSNDKVYFKKGQSNGFNGSMLSEESRQKIAAAHKRNGHVPYLKDGKPWMLGRRGAEVASWKGGVTPQRNACYSTPEWKAAVKAVWRRDNATCQRCGKHHNTAANRGTFDIHHIIGFEVVELRCAVGNLVLLCESCHYWVHSGANTNKEFLG